MAKSEEIREQGRDDEQNCVHILEVTCSWHTTRRWIITPEVKPEWLTKEELLKVYDTAIREKNELVKELKGKESELIKSYESLNPIQRFFLPKKIKNLLENCIPL